MASEVVIFNGVTFRRYPESKNRSDARYFKPSATDRTRGIQALHQEVWKAEHGPIPEGYHVHHIDHDTLNNDPSNLALKEGSAHARHHFDTDEGQARWAEAQAKGREGAKAWHASPEGRQWHVEHSKALWAERAERDVTCEQCGETFQTKDMTKVRFCSNRCKSAARRASGVDDKERRCAHCGETFTVSRYKKNRYCSKRCGGLGRRLVT